jgi:hypothetical protein
VLAAPTLACGVRGAGVGALVAWPMALAWPAYESMRSDSGESQVSILSYKRALATLAQTLMLERSESLKFSGSSIKV